MKATLTIEIPDDVLLQKLAEERLTKEQFIEAFRGSFAEEFSNDPSMPEGTKVTIAIHE